MRRMRVMQRLGAIMLLATMIVAALSSDFALYRCRMAGSVHTSCCCHGDEIATEPDTHAKIEASCCCDVEHFATLRTASDAARARARGEIALPIALGSRATLFAAKPCRNAAPAIDLSTPFRPPILQTTRVLLI